MEKTHPRCVFSILKWAIDYWKKRLRFAFFDNGRGNEDQEFLAAGIYLPSLE
jgi:hypothetical protein